MRASYFLFALLGTSAFGSGRLTDVFHAEQISVANSAALLYRSKTATPGTSCEQEAAVKIKGLKRVNIGDTIQHDGISLKVGVIEVTLFNDVLEMADNEKFKKGDRLCRIAASLGDLPNSTNCGSVWISVKNCRSLRRLNDAP